MIETEEHMNYRNRNNRLCALLVGWAGIFPALAVDTAAFKNRPVGDLGLGAFATQSIVRGDDDTLLPLPYAYLDYGRFFARLDTLGVKTFGMGYGFLELVARVNFDGFDTDVPELQGLEKRSHSIPLGIGTFQKTPIGGIFLNAFHDVNDSGGNLFEAIYAAKFMLGGVAFYPQAGVEYRDGKYVSYYYGVTPAEAAASGYPQYEPGGALNPLAALQVEIPVAGNIFLNLYWRHKWLDSSITNSPIVEKSAADTGFVALSYRFK